MKKILILANNDVGLYKFRKELIQELISPKSFIQNRNADPYEVYIDLPYGEQVDDLVKLGCKFIDTPMNRRGKNIFQELKLYLNYKKIIKRINPDIVISYTIKPNIYGGIIAKRLEIPFVANITGLGSGFEKDGFMKKLLTFLYRKSLKKADVIFFENEGNLQQLVNLKIANKNNAVKLNGAGVNTEDYGFIPYPNENQDLRFLFIGRVMKEKGVDEFFESAKLIKNKYPNIFFDVVGPFEDDYSSIVEDLSQKGIINYHGFQKNVIPFIEKCHCLVLPSYHEGMANVLLEAASSGRPIITTDIPGCREAVCDEKNGFLCKVKSSESLMEKVEKFVSLTNNERVEMGQYSRQHILAKFDKRDVVEKTLVNIDKILYN